MRKYKSPTVQWLATATVLLLVSGCAHLMKPTPAPAPQIQIFMAPAEAMNPHAVAIMNFSLKGTRKGDGPQVADMMAQALTTEGYTAKALRVDTFTADRREAIAAAKAQTAAGQAMTGEITEMVFGGRTTNTRVTLRVEVYDVESGETVWNLVGTMSVPPTHAKDKIFYVDPGKEAPLPVILSKQIVTAMARQMTGKNAVAKETPPEAIIRTGKTPRDRGGWQPYSQ
jgi:hypothetical protein